MKEILKVTIKMLNLIASKNILAIIALTFSIIAIAGVFYIKNKQTETSNVAGVSYENLDSLKDNVASVSAKQNDSQELQKDLLSQIELFKIENNKLKTNAEACKKFVPAFFLFYEKASEMFANGISGCAIKYINSGNPNQLPDGCYRWTSWKAKTGWDKLSDMWQQEPDQKYYESIKSLYKDALKYQSSCQQF